MVSSVQRDCCCTFPVFNMIVAFQFSISFSKISKSFKIIFPKHFVHFVRAKTNLEINCDENIRLVRKLLNFELSSRCFGRLKFFVGLQSLHSLAPIFQSPHYLPSKRSLGRLRLMRLRNRFQRSGSGTGCSQFALGSLRPISDHLQIVLDQFRIVADRFRIVSDIFQIVFRSLPSFSFYLSVFQFQSARAGARPSHPSAEPSGPGTGQLKFDI